jgi:Uma2 family endonuclease
MATIPRLLTYEEWLRMPPVEDGADEVVNGELRFMPPARYPHAEIIRRLLRSFTSQVNEEEVIVLGSNLGLMIGREPLSCRSPDLVVYWRDKMVIKDGLYYSPPDLVVEILSPSETRKRKEEKLEDYATIGVPEAWLMSPEARSVEILLLSAGKLVTSAVAVEGSLQPTRFPGVFIPVVPLWPE